VLFRSNVVTTSAVAQPLQPLSSALPVVLPSNPSIIPGVTPEVSSCDQQDVQPLPTGGAPRVQIVCVPRFVQANTQYTLGIMAWGGTPSYALDIDLGDKSENTLLSLAAPGNKVLKFSYASAGIHTVTVRLKDKDGRSAIVQTSIQTTGDTRTPLAILANDVIGTSWFKTPVPLYLIAFAITLGFWGGDIFDRNFGASKPHHRTRKAA